MGTDSRPVLARSNVDVDVNGDGDVGDPVSDVLITHRCRGGPSLAAAQLGQHRHDAREQFAAALVRRCLDELEHQQYVGGRRALQGRATGNGQSAGSVR